MSKACPSDLLPCPFCGEQPGEMLDSQGRTWVRCRPCRIEYVRAERWNRRTTVAALQDAAAQQQAEPGAGVAEGWVAVPIEPTPKMLEQIKFMDNITDLAMTARYKAMLAAAPEAK